MHSVRLCSTLAGPPSQPMAPVVVVAMCTCMQVRWSKTNANGSPITAYVLRGKAVDDDAYNDLYHGPLTAHLVMSLMPDVSDASKKKIYSCIFYLDTCDDTVLTHPFSLYITIPSSHHNPSSLHL